MTKRRKTVSILIPAYNEGKTIARCVQSCLDQTIKANEIIVVNDGSTDNTLSELNKFGNRIKILDLPKNTGNKSLAQQSGLKEISSQIFVSLDADTILDKYFLENILKGFDSPKTKAVCGYVKSMKNNWITACRQIDYIVGQNVHKLAQKSLNYIVVMPGCATGYETKTFLEKIRFDHDTLTEDLDFTYQFHKNSLKIEYIPEAIVYTQDPPNLKSYIRQMKRWYAGGWQNFQKHFDVMTKKPSAAMELSFAYIEGTLSAIIFLLIPLFSFHIFLLYMLPVALLVTLLISIFSAWKDKRFDLIYYSPTYIVFVYLNSILFLHSFIKEIILRNPTKIWLKADRISI
jgi:cellulose synthase/poly-beta-1,6-N-acetylglucosamine synthase-like glycosyltransferase